MKYLRMIAVVALFFAFMLPCLVSADVDTPDVVITGNPDFIVSDSTYGQHGNCSNGNGQSRSTT